jgi:hypothetical protein
MASVSKRGGKGNRHGRYYISYFDHTGKRQCRSAKTTDKATAERIAARLEADAALRRDGVIDPQLDAICDQAQRTIESHLADYKARMRTGNRSEKHVTRTLTCIRDIAEAAGFLRASDIAADAVNRYAGRLTEEKCRVRANRPSLLDRDEGLYPSACCSTPWPFRPACDPASCGA